MELTVQASEKPNGKCRLAWKCDEELGTVQFRYRHDDGRWSRWLLEGAEVDLGTRHPQGKHSITAELHSSARWLPQHSLEYTYDVGYDITPDIDKWVEQLSSDDFQDREEASQKLVAFGDGIHTLLESRAATAGAETQIRILDIMRSYKPVGAKIEDEKDE